MTVVVIAVVIVVVVTIVTVIWSFIWGYNLCITMEWNMQMYCNFSYTSK